MQKRVCPFTVGQAVTVVIPVGIGRETRCVALTTVERIGRYKLTTTDGQAWQLGGEGPYIPKKTRRWIPSSSKMIRARKPGDAKEVELAIRKNQFYHKVNTFFADDGAKKLTLEQLEAVDKVINSSET